MAQYGSAQSFGKGARLLGAALRVKVPKSTLGEVTEGHAARVAAHPEAVAPTPIDWQFVPEHERVLLTNMDGATVRTTEVDPKTKSPHKVLALTRIHTPDLERVDVNGVTLTVEHKAEAQARGFLGALNALPATTDQEALRPKPRLEGRCDGEQGYQNILLRLCVAAVLIDLWHLKGYVWEAADGLFKDDPRAQKQFRLTFNRLLKTHGGATTLTWLRKLEPPPRPAHGPMQADAAARHAAWAKLEGYVAKNVDFMDYPDARRRGLPLGDGAVESGCKDIIKQRMCGAGMTWTPTHSWQVANLRAVFLDERYPCPTDTLLDSLPRQYRCLT